MAADFISNFDEHEQLAVLEALLRLSTPERSSVPYEELADTIGLPPSAAFLALQLLEGEGIVESSAPGSNNVLWSPRNRYRAEQLVDEAQAVLAEREALLLERSLASADHKRATEEARREAECRRQQLLRAPRARPSLLALASGETA